MLDKASLVAFVPSTDLDRSEGFYVGTLGLERIEVNPFALVLRAGGTMLRVTRVGDLRPQPFTVLGWDVPDLRGTLAELVARDVPVLRFDGIGQDETGVWTTPGGDLVAWFADPDGNTLSLTQFASH
ncbi:MAG: glyoxalase [Actinobacteria bacterium 13_2_20CM_2_71_6]|nr:MAG: glyoxalase [Actinobacteria bacterium 13_2_20CM_2_71_6]